jgi:hypothetical protein
MDQDRDAIVAELNQLQKVRQGIVAVAIVLLVVSLFQPLGVLAVLRSIAWVGAGVVSLVHASKAKQAGLPSSYGPALIYFLVAILPLVRGR